MVANAAVVFKKPSVAGNAVTANGVAIAHKLAHVVGAALSTCNFNTVDMTTPGGNKFHMEDRLEVSGLDILNEAERADRVKQIRGQIAKLHEYMQDEHRHMLERSFSHTDRLHSQFFNGSSRLGFQGLFSDRFGDIINKVFPDTVIPGFSSFRRHDQASQASRGAATAAKETSDSIVADGIDQKEIAVEVPVEAIIDAFNNVTSQTRNAPITLLDATSEWGNGVKSKLATYCQKFPQHISTVIDRAGGSITHQFDSPEIREKYTLQHDLHLGSLEDCCAIPCTRAAQNVRAQIAGGPSVRPINDATAGFVNTGEHS